LLARLPETAIPFEIINSILPGGFLAWRIYRYGLFSPVFCSKQYRLAGQAPVPASFMYEKVPEPTSLMSEKHIFSPHKKNILLKPPKGKSICVADSGCGTVVVIHHDADPLKLGILILLKNIS
jgi:hypothetical protein